MVSRFYKNIEIQAAGASEALLSTDPFDVYRIFSSGVVVLAGNVTITDDGLWVEGNEIEIKYTATLTKGAFNVTIFGYSLTTEQAAAGNIIIKAYNIGGAYMTTVITSAGTAQIGTADIVDEAVTLGKMADLARGSIIVGGAANRPTALDAKTNAQILIGNATDLVSVAQTGDGAFNNAGLFGITAGVIVNADIHADANIAVSKLETSTDGQMIVGVTATGKFAKVGVGTDLVVSPAGVATIQAGVVTPEKASANLTDDEINVDVSFATGSVGGFFTTIAPCNGTILEINGTVTFLIEATNNGTVTPDINGVPVTGGLVTFTAGDALNQDRAGTAVTANNTFLTGDEINLVTAKVTAGGTARMTIKYRKTS